jgi:hypothetical protein
VGAVLPVPACGAASAKLVNDLQHRSKRKYMGLGGFRL